MEVVATAKWVRTTARKARLVSSMVTGLPVAEALVVLKFSPRSAAVDIAKVIKSAAANAEHNYNLDVSSLRVARVEVDGAMIIKRWRAKPRGMAGSIFKRTSHLRAFVTDDEMPANVRRRRDCGKATSGTPSHAEATHGRGGVDGTESQPDRFPPRVLPLLGSPLVRRQGVHEAAP